MNRSRLLMIGGLALAVGLLVAFSVYNKLRTSPGSNSSERAVRVVVAADDVLVGIKLDAHDVRVITLPESAAPPGAFSDPAKVLGRGAILPISKGEFILPSKLAALNAGGGLPSLIPPGMRAVSVRVNDVVSVAGFVQPGTRVDVLATGNEAGSDDRQTTTVLENVAVIAVGKSLDRSTLHRRADRPGDYPAGFSGRRPEAGAGFAGGPHSTLFAQSAGHKKGRHWRHPHQFVVSRCDSGAGSVQSESSEGGSESSGDSTSALSGGKNPWQQTG